MSGVMVFPWGGQKPYTDFTLHPYFYIPWNKDLPEGTTSNFVKYKATDGETIKKVVCKKAWDVPEIRGDIHYEAKTQFADRYWIDKVKHVNPVKPIVANIDIEAGSEGGSLSQHIIETAPNPILVIGCEINGVVYQLYWHRSIKQTEEIRIKGRVMIGYATEQQMLQQFVTLVNKMKVDIIAGFNALHYDIPYLLKRYEVLGISANRMSPMGFAGITKSKQCMIKGIAKFDYLLGYKRLSRREYTRNRLGDVLERELGITKYEGIDASQMTRAWNRDHLEVIQYNYEDVVKMVQLDKHMGILDAHITFHEVFRCNLEDTLHSGKMVMMHICSEIPELIYPSYNTPKVDIRGAEPKPPKVGLHEYVLFEDLTSAYPMSMISANMSPETLVTGDTDKEVINVGGTRFLSHQVVKGAYPKYIEKMFDMKEEWGRKRGEFEYKSVEWKKANWIREAYKVGINTVYGDCADPHSKLYNPAIANAVTHIVRGVADFAAHEINRLGHERVFGHTDSVGFKTKYTSIENLVKVGKEVEDHLNETFPHHLRQYNIPYDEAKMSIVFEKIARRGIFSGKTRYAISIIWIEGKEMKEPYVEVKGFDAIRSDSSPLARRLQEDMLKKILDGEERRQIEPAFVKEMAKIEKGEYGVTEVGVPATIKMHLSEYAYNNYRRKAVEWSNKHLKTSFSLGSKPFFIKANVPSIYGDVSYIALDDDTKLPDWVRIDWKEMKNITKRKLGYVYQCMGWDINALDGQKTLADFCDGSASQKEAFS